jgi:toxin HigB-1
VAIESFKNAFAANAFEGRATKGKPSNFLKVARRKLWMIHAAAKLGDLRSPPGNQLEALKDDRLGQHSIRINDQWRVCFVWTDDGAEQVEIVDYH